MAMILKRVYMITDVKVRISRSFYIDAENPDDSEEVYDEARKRALIDGDEGNVTFRSRAEAALEEMVVDEARSMWSDLSWSDLDNLEVDFTWNWREIEVCEWCGSSTCESTPSDCESAPEWCYDCDNALDDCECEDDKKEEAGVVIEVVDVKNQIEKILADASEVESIL